MKSQTALGSTCEKYGQKLASAFPEGCVPDTGRYNDIKLKILRFTPMRDYLSSYICKKIVKYLR